MGQTSSSIRANNAMRDETGSPRPDDVHACFTELVEGRGGAARARFHPQTVAEAESLLEAHRAIEAELGADAKVGPAGGGLSPGREFDGFRIEGLIGRGATGEVYSAREGSTGRAVAIKLLPQELSRAGAERIDREARALASLEHPGIARLYRAGSVPAGGSRQRYIAMELVRDARTLTEWRSEAARSPRACVQMVAEICEAVAYAHGRGVIHCDLKPGNILVDADGRAVVIDFGIARVLDADGNPAATVSLLGDRVAGTLAYIAPESLEARAGADVRADVHALGAILYELLAERPFRALEGLALPQRLAVIAASSPPRLADRDRTFRGDLDRIVSRATARVPGERYASASQLAADLRAHLAGQPVLPELQSPRERIARAVARHRVAVGVAALIAATLVASSAISLRFAANSREEARLANLSVAARAIDDADLLIAKQHLALLGPDDRSPERALIERAVALQGTVIDGGDWYDLAWAPDGTWFVANGHARGNTLMELSILRRFDRTADGGFTPRWTIPAAESGIHGCAITADGATIIDIDATGRLRLTDSESGEIRARLDPPSGPGAGLAVDVREDGLIASHRGLAEFRTLEDPVRITASIDPRAGTSRLITFAPGMSDRVACVADGGAVLLDARAGTVLQRFETPPAFQTAACWSPDGSRLFIAGWDRTLRAYTSDQAAPIWSAHGHRDSIWSAEMLDAETVATAGADGTLRLWNARDGAPIAAIPISDDIVWAIDIDPGRRSVLVGSRLGLREVPIASLRDWSGTPGHRADLAHAGPWIAEPRADGRVALRSSDASPRQIDPPGEGPVDKVALARDGSLLAALRRDGTLSVLALPGGELLSSTRALAAEDLHEPNGITGLALDRERRRLYAASRRDGCVAIDIDSGRTAWSLVFGSQCAAITASADGSTLFISDRDGQLARIDARTGSVVASTRRQRTRASCLAATDDGSRLLAGGSDGSLRILDAGTLEEQLSIRVSPASLRSIRMTDAGIELIDKLGVRRMR